MESGWGKFWTLITGAAGIAGVEFLSRHALLSIPLPELTHENLLYIGEWMKIIQQLGLSIATFYFLKRQNNGNRKKRTDH